MVCAGRKPSKVPTLPFWMDSRPSSWGAQAVLQGFPTHLSQSQTASLRFLGPQGCAGYGGGVIQRGAETATPYPQAGSVPCYPVSPPSTCQGPRRGPHLTRQSLWALGVFRGRCPLTLHSQRTAVQRGWDTKGRSGPGPRGASTPPPFVGGGRPPSFIRPGGRAANHTAEEAEWSAAHAGMLGRPWTPAQHGPQQGRSSLPGSSRCFKPG